MRVGYPCINRSIGCTPSRTFRLASYSDNRLRDIVQANLSCLEKILWYNAEHHLLFLRITSDLVPFASHPVCNFPWDEHFSSEFDRLGASIRNLGFRISMHPDQFVLLNTPDEGVFSRSVDELAYHAKLLDLMGLNLSTKIQIHVGGVYGDKMKSMDRFARQADQLDPSIRNRLVIENDERSYTIRDCLAIHEQTGIPVIMDSFHHTLLNDGTEFADLLDPVCRTWKRADGIPMVDYSSQEPGKRAGAHANHIVPADFLEFLTVTQPADFDVMLEIKDKERSALEALSIAHGDPRLVPGGFQ
jgi:UV DNA damage endonuclease